MVSSDTSLKQREDREHLLAFGFPPYQVDEALKRYQDLDQALDFCLCYEQRTAQEAGARSVSGAPNFQSVDLDAVGCFRSRFSSHHHESDQVPSGKEMVRFADHDVPSNPPPSPHSEQTPGERPSHPVTAKQESQVIDVDAPWTSGEFQEEDEDAIQRAMELSRQEAQDHVRPSLSLCWQGMMGDMQSQGMNQALAESMRTATLHRNDNEPLGAPPAKRRRLGQHIPVILRPTSSQYAWLPPTLQALYACKPFRNAVLALPLAHPAPGGDGSGFEGFWNGRLVFPTPSDRSGLAIVLALQRLFAFMMHTTRHAISLADFEFALEAASLDVEYEPVMQIQAFLHRTQESWTYAASLGQDAGGDSPVREANDEVTQRRLQTLAQRGCRFNLQTLQPTGESDSMVAIRLRTTPATAQELEQNALLRALDACFLVEDNSDPPFLVVPGQVAFFLVDRRDHALLPYDQRRLFDYPMTLYLDRYSAHKLPTVLENRARLKLLRQQRASVVERLAKLKDPKNVSSLEGALEYLTKLARPKDEAGLERQRFLIKHFTVAQQAASNQAALYAEQLAAIQTEASTVFESDDMRDIGPYYPVAMVFSNGANHLHSYVIDNEMERAFKVTPTDAFEVDPRSAVEDTTGLHTGQGLTLLCYSAGENVEAFDPADLTEGIRLAIEQDNEHFAAEVAADMDAEVPSMPTEAVQSDPSSAGMQTAENTYAAAPPPEQHTPSSSVEAPLGDQIQEVERIRGGAALPRGAQEDDEDDDSGSEDDLMGMAGDECGVQLGFIQDMPRRGLDVWSMTGKVGGRPLWLNPNSPLRVDQLRCGICGRQTAFLFQLSAPDDENIEAYYRMLYVFACRSAGCIAQDSAKSVRVFRMQLREGAEALVSDLSALQLSSIPRSKTLTNPDVDMGPAYSEHELVSEPEGSLSVPDSIMHIIAPRIDAAAGPDAAEPDTRVAVDSAFLRFQRRLSHEPEQVLRYYFGHPSPEPLWISDSQKADPTRIPRCELCGAQRTCELQILPTLISNLGIKDETLPDSFDFGTLLVYTCPERCAVSDSGWKEEYCHAQSISEQGMSLTGWRA